MAHSAVQTCVLIGLVIAFGAAIKCSLSEAAETAICDAQRKQAAAPPQIHTVIPPETQALLNSLEDMKRSALTLSDEPVVCPDVSDNMSIGTP